ncbi:MAG: 3-deoxy-manno-octulosonate cytidylyltransferase [Puniceicoccales bacterium]|nr:3-deoxy-manno-octulosonate cytidylyltransferase [Puniceicoccales bacterium]
MKISIAIPARYASTRLPAKVLADLGGWPVLRHVWHRSIASGVADEVVVLSESRAVMETVESWGGRCELTSENCQTGTERIAEALGALCGDIVVNVQADEPFIDPLAIRLLAEAAKKNGDVPVHTAVYKISDGGAIDNPNVVKVTLSHEGKALYFSRSPIPHLRDCPRNQWIARNLHIGHIGVYAYGRKFLEQLPSMARSPLAEAESLEQLRFLQAGYSIGTVAVNSPSLAIDTAHDLEVARALLLKDRNLSQW